MPIQSRWLETKSAVMRTKENPNLLVPKNLSNIDGFDKEKGEILQEEVQVVKIYQIFSIDKEKTPKSQISDFLMKISA